MKTVTEFTVPSLAEADGDYATIEGKLALLGTEAALTDRRISDLEADLRTRPAPRYQSGVAELLGETIDQDLQTRPARLAELRKHAADVDAATEIVRRRLIDRRGQASVAACTAVRSEYGRRIGVLSAALEAVQVARQSVDSLLDDLEAEGIQSSYLPIVHPSFLGDRRDGHIHRFIREAKEAGYV